MKNTFIFAGLISFAISAVLAPLIIPLLTRIKVGQTEREDGPKSHLSKFLNIIIEYFHTFPALFAHKLI